MSQSSILTKDFLGKTWLKGVPESAGTKTGEYLSWGIMTVFVLIALVSRITLWGLTELKMEFLPQASQVISLSLIWRRLS